MDEDLLNVMKKFRKDSTSRELIQEYYDNLNSLNYLEYLTNYPKDTLIDNCIKSYFFRPDYDHIERKCFVFGMCFFQTSEMLDQAGLERKVNDEEDLAELIDYRIKDFKYLMEGQKCNLSNRYSFDGIVCEAKDYYNFDQKQKRK